MNIGYDAKRIVRNGTGLGSYGRTLINSISAVDTDDMLSLYAPDEGRDDLRSQIVTYGPMCPSTIPTTSRTGSSVPCGAVMAS